MLEMSDTAISRFSIPDLQSLPDHMRSRMEETQEKMGFIPNVFWMLARRPQEWDAFFAYHDALMDKETALTKADRELIVVATSAVNSCLYCVVAHGAIARIRAKNPRISDQVATDFRKADLSARQRTMLEFAVKLAGTPALIEEADFQRLREAGFEEEDIWDIGSITAFFSLSNRLAHFTALRPNPEFHLLGRLPAPAKG